MSTTSFAALHGVRSSLVIDCRAHAPEIIYWGPRLESNTDYTLIADLSMRQEAPASVEKEPAISLSPLLAAGFTGQTSIHVLRDSDTWGVYPKIRDVSMTSDEELTITSEDSTNRITLYHTLKIDPESDIISAKTTIKNHHERGLHVEWCAAPTFPIPSKYNDIISFEGRWAKEFQTRRHTRYEGTFLQENRKGRTSHDNFPGLVLAESNTNDLQGNALGFHLAWSGNHRLCVEELHDGRALAQMGELLFPGEVTIEQNDSYQSPTVYATFSQKGLNGVTQNFHTFVRSQILSESITLKPRPVHFNTWEALYFDHDNEKLADLVEAAAEIGAERFVLDDGWFKGRRNDAAGLGDWYVDTRIYPDGLGPLIENVKAAGMEFGLWFEPEMVNPDSDLYRDHPDWVLQLENAPVVMARNQLVLDLTRAEVCEYLFERINTLLTEYDIAYIKWDMNRDIHHPASKEGAPAVHQQTLALYALINAIRKRHPDLEIESCASGGGRVDLGILSCTDRVWTSDSNDALDRLSIQQGFSLFFPPEIMGAHVGPFECHITGRKIPIETRVSTAFFGHMGMEVNLLEMQEDERSTLKRGISLHKRYRHILHHGQLIRFHTTDHAHSFAVMSQDLRCAIYTYTDIFGHTENQPKPFRFCGVEAKANYKVSLIWPENKTHLHDWQTTLSKHIFPGVLLLEVGIQLPLIKPETSLIFLVEKV